MVEFLSGLLIGTFIGITLMCILQVAKEKMRRKSKYGKANNM